jgi:hypothetical protein
MNILFWILLLGIVAAAIIIPVILTIHHSSGKDSCKGVNCGSHGSCKNGKCICKDGWMGKHCDQSPDGPCKGVDCGIHGDCKDGKCICKDGWTGEHCENPPVSGFTNIKSATGGGGYCKGNRDSYPHWKALSNISQDDCSKSCANDKNCVAFDYNKDQKSCQLFSFSSDGGYDQGPSKGWSKNNESRFPGYASPWRCTPDPLPYPMNEGGCRTAYTDDCVEDKGWACYAKGTGPDISWWGPDKKPLPSDDPDSSKLQFLTSNPYIPTYLLLKTPGNFYYWFYYLIKNAKKFLILCNAYIKLGIHSSEDPDDYKNQIYYVLLEALNRNVQVTCVNVNNDQQQCQIDFATQPGFNDHLGKNLNYVDFSTIKYIFRKMTLI